MTSETPAPLRVPRVTFYRFLPNARMPQRADRAAAGTLPTRAFRYCEPVVIAYVDNHGSSTERVVDPVSVEGGVLTAHDHRSGREEPVEGARVLLEIDQAPPPHPRRSQHHRRLGHVRPCLSARARRAIRLAQAVAPLFGAPPMGAGTADKPGVPVRGRVVHLDPV